MKCGKTELTKGIRYVIILTAFVHQSYAGSFDLTETVWGKATLGTDVQPELLYAIALQESRELTDGLAQPRPFVIRVGNDVFTFRGWHEASERLAEFTEDESVNLRSIDVGMLQVNAGWHRDRVESLSELLIPAINIRVAAEILEEATSSTSDPVIGVGRYHSYTPALARSYGESVVGIACRLGSASLEHLCSYGTGGGGDQ